MVDIYDEIVRIKNEGSVAALATIVWVKGSTPRAEGSKMLIRNDGSILGSVGGGCTEADVWKAAMKVIEEEKPEVLNFDLTGREDTPGGLICGGTMQVFVEPIVAQPTVYLFGAVAVLFNPLAPIHLSRGTWQVLDPAAAIAFLVTAVALASPNTTQTMKGEQVDD